MKTQLFFFSDLPAVLHSSVIKLLAKPHPHDRNSGRENMEALYYLDLSLLQQYENFASCFVPGNSVLSLLLVV